METTKHPASETPETYTYCGITAPLALWQEVGLDIVHWVGDVIEFPRRKDSYGVQGARDGELIEARLTSGSAGEAALVWLVAERRRQQEESSRINTIRQQIEAQKKSDDVAIHAARIHRQAAELECLARGISKSAINSRLE